jgi:outer membrane protein OmpA-like peptidoglycan-associated protein/uncharacterized protein YidB (DUF937 family)
MFDALVRDIAQRFGLGDKARDLLGELLALIFDEKNGGIAGLLARFRQQGLGDLFASWLGGTQAKPAEPRDIEAALGPGAVSGIADRLGIGRDTVLAASSAMLPRLIGLLTPGGQLPTGVPAAATAFLGGWHPGGDATRTAAAATAVTRSSAAPGWLKWLALALLVLLLGWCMLNRTPEAPPPAGADRAAPPASTIPTANPTLSITNDGGKASYSGRVGAEADRTRIADTLNAAFGAGNATGQVDIDANTKPAGWLAALGSLLPDFAKAPGAKLDFDGNTITLGGSLQDADRASLAALLRRLYDGYTLKGLEAGGAMQSASDALKALMPGKYSAADLVKALNLMTIHFDTGSDAISADSLDVLNDAAAALKNAPAGTKVEIDGHTDNTGDAAANLKLSEARANAVRGKLVELGVTADMLLAKGYGDTRPVADNATEEGRAKNRRMEFTVVE